MAKKKDTRSIIKDAFTEHNQQFGGAWIEFPKNKAQNTVYTYDRGLTNRVGVQENNLKKRLDEKNPNARRIKKR